MYIIESESNHVYFKCFVKGENIEFTIPILLAILFRALLLTFFPLLLNDNWKQMRILGSQYMGLGFA
jgi:hypothetical protein